MPTYDRIDEPGCHDRADLVCDPLGRLRAVYDSESQLAGEDAPFGVDLVGGEICAELT